MQRSSSVIFRTVSPLRSTFHDPKVGLCNHEGADARQTALYGTIVHPSVYFLQDTYPNLGIKVALEGLDRGLSEFQKQIELAGGIKFFPWIVQRDFTLRFDQFRILICRRTGVGKSTLLNRVFGVPMVKLQLKIPAWKHTC
jgi:hypothetical protein